MSILRNLFGKSKPPDWADFLTGREYETFLDLIHAHFQTRTGEVTIQDGVVTVQESGKQYGLQNLVQVCHMNDMRLWKRIIESHFESFDKAEMERQELDRKINSFSDIRDFLAVRLWSASYLDSFSPADIVHRKDLEGTVSVLVFDLPSSIQPVASEEASLWNKNLQDLFTIALQNVQGKTIPNTAMEKLGKNTQIILLSGDSFYITTYVLFLENLPNCVGTHGSLVAIPHRHAMVCYPIKDMNVIHAVNSLIPVVDRMYHEGPGSISPFLYWYDGIQFTNLPYKITDKQLQFTPPERFVDFLNELTESTQD